MGRKENPVVRDVPAVGRLADFQRTWRAAAGLTYEDLAHATGWSAAALRNAASGNRPPRRDIVRDAVTHCGGPGEEVIDLWKEARYRQRLADNPRPQAPATSLVRTRRDLAALLKELYELDGAPSMAEMEERTDRRLGHSAAHRIVTRKIIPVDREQFEAFLDAVEVQEPQRVECMQTWDRVITLNDPERFLRKVPHLWELRQELDLLRTVDDLVAALEVLRTAAGSPSDEQIAERTIRTGGLATPETAVTKIMAGTGSVDLFLTSVLRALGVPPDERILWRRAWDRVLREDEARREPPPPVRQATHFSDLPG